jgi:hypothetical protein
VAKTEQIILIVFSRIIFHKKLHLAHLQNSMLDVIKPREKYIMENNYWHEMVVLTGLTLLPHTLALTSAVKKIHTSSCLHKRNIAFLLTCWRRCY